jgi:hypothetical protein
MSDAESLGLYDSELEVVIAEERHGSGSGAAQPMGAGNRTPVDDDARFAPPPPPAHALANSAPAAPAEPPSGLQRAVGALRWALPLAQRILPLLDGNIATTVSNILNPRPPAPPPAAPVDLAPIENGLAELKTQQRDLRDQFVEQNTSLKRVEDQLEMVREATDRNTLEQQELLEDLKTVGNKVNLVAILALGLLVVSIALNVVMFLHIQRVLP